jgi:hypothetical protein
MENGRNEKNGVEDFESIPETRDSLSTYMPQSKE